MSQPLVSVCIPTYNGAAFLQEALDSVMVQTYKNLEVIISDDGSKDGSWELLQSFRESVLYPVHLVQHAPSGIGANWNHTLALSKGTYIKFLFQDDILEPSCIEKMVSFMETNKTYGLVASKRDFISETTGDPHIEAWIEQYKNLQCQFSNEGEILHLDRTLFARDDFMKSPLNKIGEPPTTLFRKVILDEIGYFDERLKQVLDYVFYYRVLKKYPIAILPEKLVKFRIHPNQATNVNRSQSIPDYEEYDKILYQEFIDLLHPWEQHRLKSKYNRWYTLQKKLKTKIKKTLRG